MAPDPDNSPDPLPAANPPGSKAGEFAERELWALDEPVELPPVHVVPRRDALPTPNSRPLLAPADTADSSEPSPAPPPSGPNPAIPAPRATTPRAARPSKLAVNKSSKQSNTLLPAPKHALDDLDDGVFEDAPEITPPSSPASPADEPPATGSPPEIEEDAPHEPPDPTPTAASPDPGTLAVPPAPVPAKPAPAVTSNPLSKAEKLSLAAIFVALVAIAVWALGVFYSHIPTRGNVRHETKFPVKGQLVTIADASTYWRAPVREGPNPDSVRIETRLIPVLKIRIEGNNHGALRVFFRNEAGDPVGDSITRSFDGGSFKPQGLTEIEIPATAGFNDEGMHAAYRADETKPWRVEIHEGPDATSPFHQFNKVLEMPISSTRR